MPNSETHTAITRAALKLQKEAIPFQDELAEEYCQLPDRFTFTSLGSEWKKYDFETDGIPFHYLPDSTPDDLYRFWKRVDGRLTHCRNFVNEHFLHAHAGFDHYISEAVACGRAGQWQETAKYIGCLIHVLEDSTFGLHTLEGFMGSDAFVLDRLTGSMASLELCKIKLDDQITLPEYVPEMLGYSVSEAVSGIYAELCRYNLSSRQCCFRYFTAPDESAAREEIRKMFNNALKLTSDAVFTVYSLISGKFDHPLYRYLEDFEPCEFPFGGNNGYRFRRFEIGHVLDGNGSPIPLKSARGVFEHGISFAAHFEGRLLYHLPEKIYKKFQCVVALHPDLPMLEPVELTIVNNGNIVNELKLDQEQHDFMLEIDDPAGEFGLTYRIAESSGEVIELLDPKLFYA